MNSNSEEKLFMLPVLPLDTLEMEEALYRLDNQSATMKVKIYIDNKSVKQHTPFD